MDISWKTNEYGRAGDLAKLNAVRNDPTKSKFVRNQADNSHRVIVEQLKDRKLMGLREQLIKAARAGDLEAQDRIARQMKAYSKEDQETGL